MSTRSTIADLPLVVHIVFRFDYGGLENGVANVVNALTGRDSRHAIIALTEATEFRKRLRRDVQVFALGKKPGKDPAAYLRLYRLLRRLKPTIVHTRNIGTLDCAFIAFLARVPVRIHGEHGWDVFDPDGTSRKYRLLRMAMAPFVQRFITVSQDLREWLVNAVGIPSRKVSHICNGVDTDRFRATSGIDSATLAPCFGDPDTIVIGTVTRFSRIKDPMNLVEAFIKVQRTSLPGGPRICLAMLGDGELRTPALERLAEAELDDRAWLPGSRDDIPELLGIMDVFVLASYREGISNTILEAMASGLPVVATNTGGNGELVDNGATGALVPPADSDALADTLMRYVRDRTLREKHGEASRARAVTRFSIATMVNKYSSLYSQALAA